MKQLELFPTATKVAPPSVTTVYPWGFPIDVAYELDQGELPTWDDPGYEPYIIVEGVKIGGVEVYEMLNDTQLLRIEAAVGRACNL